MTDQTRSRYEVTVNGYKTILNLTPKMAKQYEDAQLWPADGSQAGVDVDADLAEAQVKADAGVANKAEAGAANKARGAANK